MTSLCDEVTRWPNVALRSFLYLQRRAPESVLPRMRLSSGGDDLV